MASAPKLLALSRLAFPAGLCAAYATYNSYESALTAQADAAKASGLTPDAFTDLKLIKKEKLTHNSYMLRFELPDGQPANLPVASCILTKASLQGPGDEQPKVVVRPYTPVSAPDAPGHLDLVIKAYAQGKMSKHMGELKVGDSLAFKGPIMKYPYSANTKKAIGMIAGGTGITPMLQVADAILANPADKTKVSLLFANVSEGDILLKDKIDAMAAAHPDRFRVHYVVDKPRWGGIFWKGGAGYVTRDMLAAHMPAASSGSDALIMVCGPPGMMAAVSGDKAQDKSQGELTGLLKAMGYSAQQVYKF
uniref:NADH-cytochrome b5 reductase n=1 Tax=Tetradesmus obliquus TaxID=3088 RepID=A0A383W2U1_TETOB|eukprot:jgi/Sobl393_1/1186/SZX71354.1